MKKMELRTMFSPLLTVPIINMCLSCAICNTELSESIWLCVGNTSIYEPSIPVHQILWILTFTVA